ncbi:hypothetical protein HWV62_33317 [Athelia sp. TMB]|nr:hypothetical protein HWV62_33317 [Athelia sp. TMB]
MAERPRYTPSDMSIYQQRSDFFTFWLHDLLCRDEMSLDVKRKALTEVIIYTSRINTHFQNQIDLRDWLEPLWNSWIAGQGENPPRSLTEAELAAESSRPVGIDPLALPAALDDAFPELLITSALEDLLNAYPLRGSAKPNEDVKMYDPDDLDDAEDDIAPKVSLKSKRARAAKHPQPARSPYPTRSATAPVGTEKVSKQDSESSLRPRGLEHQRSATPGKPGASQPAGEIAPGKDPKKRGNTKGKPTKKALDLLKTILEDPGFQYTALAPSDNGACDLCKKRDQMCIIASTHAMVKGKGIRWKSCGLCYTGKTACSLYQKDVHAEESKGEELLILFYANAYYINWFGLLRVICHAFSDTGDDDASSDADFNISDEDYASLRPITKPQMVKMLDVIRADFSDQEARLRSIVSDNHRETVSNFNARLDLLDSRYASLHDEHVTLQRQYDDLRADNEVLKTLVEEKMDSLRPGFDALTRLLNVGSLKPGVEGLTRLLNNGVSPVASDNLALHVSYWLVSLFSHSYYHGAANVYGRFLRDVEQVALCLRAAAIFDVTTPTPLPLGGLLQGECKHAGRILAMAMKNSVRMSWSAQEYAEALPPRPHGHDGPVESDMERKYHPAFAHPVPTLHTPHTVIDRDGRIIAWYLPGILTKARQVFANGYVKWHFLIDHDSTPCGMQTPGFNRTFEEGRLLEAGEGVGICSGVRAGAPYHSREPSIFRQDGLKWRMM